jgi:putative methionine-R-sulfoxide reductase with GAF domain
MRIEPAALARALGALDAVDLDRGLGPSVLQLVTMTKQLLEVDGVGLMLVDAEGVLRWAAASDQQAEQLEQAQEELAQGPCTDAFWQRAPVPVRDVTREGAQQIAAVLLDASFRAALSVPVELAGGPIGTLDAYARGERAWNESEVSALQACAGVVANLLGHAVAAYTQGRLTRQLQIALEHRVVIEQAKGALMERELLDAATAFERLRSVARSRQRTAGEVAREVLAGMPLPSSPAEGTSPTRKLAVVAYQQAAGLHERLAALYEQLGHPDRARQEWQRAAAVRARAEHERDSRTRPTPPHGS